jgi:hypothetical protein
MMAVGCGGDQPEPPDALEVARSLAQAASPATTAGEPGGTTLVEVDELPSPDPSTFLGASRVVNLWVGPNGATQTVDVWGRRTFTNGPVLLVERLEFGEVSDYFGVPPGYVVEIVGAGAGPDGLPLGGVLASRDLSRITTVFTNADEAGTPEAWAIFEVDTTGSFGAPQLPAAGRGLVVLQQANTDAFRTSLESAGVSDSYYVGDGSGACIPQRAEATGQAPAILGGTQPVAYEIEPGGLAFELYPWTDPARCEASPVAEFEVEVAADQAVIGLLYTRDGATLELLRLPITVSA